MIKVNFEIVDINIEKGVAYVKFWADGATVERFGADIGPYEILMLPECKDMTDQELQAHIASWGASIVKRQEDALNAEQEGVINKYQSLINDPKSIEVEF